MKYLIVCDYRENLKNYYEDEQVLYNDHPSMKNIEDIAAAINALGYPCEYFGGIPELIHAIDNHHKFENCVFLNFTDGMDQNYSRVQAPVLLDILDVPYSGSDVFPSVLMNNKHFCKQALRDMNILMPKSCIVNHLIPLNYEEISLWKYPLFVKPNCEGYSLGISQDSVCHTWAELEYKVNKLLAEFDEIIIEEYVPGIDVTNYLIGNNGIYCINDIIISELHDKTPYAVYDDIAKHNKLRTLLYNEEYLSSEILQKIRTQSIQIATQIGARDICRIDYRVDINSSKITFIEINSAPRFSSTSEIGFIAQKRNLSFSDMVKLYINTFNKRIKIADN